MCVYEIPMECIQRNSEIRVIHQNSYRTKRMAIVCGVVFQRSSRTSRSENKNINFHIYMIRYESQPNEYTYELKMKDKQNQ